MNTLIAVVAFVLLVAGTISVALAEGLLVAGVFAVVWLLFVGLVGGAVSALTTTFTRRR
jgi:hypothetical protein